ncbi:ABC transporter ATP-binding protein [Deinococcus cellulosilyticus]|uniref:ABC transporter ATP-binding protein n=1 Tax=Deinococcus cellulosilyticus (strain DSM 18568 / NBRC 106333 / KACC 11606 / 5516J-15) TaxID=1223518 RepID=A0A511MW21_DEIC1|nr:ABC transporter ATP-binding protein [Deinococcus cellulosilyticus]GEM44773.1 ABC transporter ATP-binding protein [Deinococcus cellulosilyticus NBRC 106333 = KACC 11606]
MTQSTPIITLDGLGKRFGEGKKSFTALSNIEFEVFENDFITLVGASGCGKSTLLRIIAGLEHFTEGEVTVLGKPVRGPGMDRGMVFQNYSLYPWLTVYENIVYPYSVPRFSRQNPDVLLEAGYRASMLIQLMGLETSRDAYPSQLSGGMQQRVAIARALITRPKILLMDEPFGALDAQTREVMHDLIRHVYLMEGTTILFVTHDVDEAVYLGNKVLVLAPRPGRIDSVYDVPFERFRTREMKFSAAFYDLRERILARIRETAGTSTDEDLLRKLSTKMQAG